MDSILRVAKMSSESKQLGVLIIGTGIFARRAYLPALSELKNEFKLVACANRSKDKAIDFAKEAGLPEDSVYTDVLKAMKREDVDVVACLLPVQYNLEFVKAAVHSGKHIMIEKPIAHTLEDAREIVALARQGQQVIMVAENYAYQEKFQKCAEAVKKGEIGEIVNLTFTKSNTFTPSPYHATAWRQTPQHSGGYLSDGGVHDWAVITAIAGEVEEVFAYTKWVEPILGSDDVIAVALKFKNGAIGTYSLSFVAANTSGFRLEVRGRKGTLVVDNMDATLFLGSTGEEQKLSGSQGNGVKAEWEDFHKAVAKGEPLLLKPEEAFHHYAVISAAMESAKLRLPVKVEAV